MTRFISHKYPRSANKLLITQEYAMPYYAAFNGVIMLLLLVQIVSGGMGIDLLWWVVIGEALALGLGNLLGRARLRRTYAQLFFVSDHFSLISVHDILSGEEHQAFPLKFANASLDPEGDRLTLHFSDQVVVLQREDWEEFDLICEYFFAAQY
ncbi:MAG: hypothetical protein D6722_20270 [Bacteroidetes bacterium]|nr:MAG: hypothetical protein D6722_20270 [Bacteroidota bacterium]